MSAGHHHDHDHGDAHDPHAPVNEAHGVSDESALLERALRRVRDGDILMAHLGIWSRQDPFAPMLDPLLRGLRERGLCFATLASHPEYSAAFASRRQP